MSALLLPAFPRSLEKFDKVFGVSFQFQAFDMVRHCFILGCKTNKWRKSRNLDRIPAFFSFPKTAPLLEEWKKVLPCRAKFKREIRHSDSLCSLHFKNEDVVKSDIIFVEGDVFKFGRPTWTLKKMALPCYFDNNNPDEEKLLRSIRHSKSKQEPYADKIEQVKSLKGTFQTMGREFRKELSDGSNGYEQLMSAVSLSSSMETKHFAASCCSNNRIPQLVPTNHFSTQELSVMTAFEMDMKRPSFKSYSIEQLHLDVLDIPVPRNWIFFQNENKYHTIFLTLKSSTSAEKSVKFLGTCCPYVTVGGKTMQHRPINSKEEIEELLQNVNAQ